MTDYARGGYVGGSDVPVSRLNDGPHFTAAEVRRLGPSLLDAALRRVGTVPAFARHLTGGPVKITHPNKRYTGPVVAGDVRLFFVDGETESTNLKAAQRKALEQAGYTVESTRTKADSE